MLTLYAEPFLKRHYAPLFSWASLSLALTAAAGLVLPFVLAYASGSFWLKLATSFEQPKVGFTGNMVLLLEGNVRAASSILPLSIYWASSEAYNVHYNDHTRVPTIKFRDTDVNRDGIVDYFDLWLTIPLRDNEDIYHVRLGLEMQYVLYDVIRFKMSALALHDLMTTTPGSSVDVEADLQLVQRDRVRDGRLWDMNADPIWNFTDSRSTWEWRAVLERYNQRDVRTTLAPLTELWQAPRAQSSNFQIHTRIHFPEQAVTYRPKLAETLKSGWIQYISFLVLFWAVSSWVYSFIFRHQIIRTYVQPDRVPASRGFKTHSF
ncbi:uncharacterized protein BJ171DRAFT_582493 [Polychytrium aggregatum]|uniref:uncharacterized protein n=1 Tax=Polychytrium aggregatum TaxID=110093 RepID=UPI0022FE1147|nr:uncharacterized protein BJ171DRAFT_582493 [Polychytrium aggregatum]KAI9204115.1 transmembrane protein [Polychytrium aggregatum]